MNIKIHIVFSHGQNLRKMLSFNVVEFLLRVEGTVRGGGSRNSLFALRMPTKQSPSGNQGKGVIPSRASSSINISSMFLGDCSQAFLLLPWFAKVGFLYPPPFPHGRQCSQNSRAILADGMIWCKYSAFPTLIQLLKAKIPKWSVTPCPLLK